MRKVAVITGVDKYRYLPKSNWLRYCWADAESAWWWCVLGWGWMGWEFLIFRDKESSSIEVMGGSIKVKPAFKDYVFNTLKSLAVELKPGDHLLHFHSGHGGQEQALDQTTEGNYWDEGLIFSDYKNADQGFGRDDELVEIMRSFDPGVVKLSFLDTCHSGGMVRGGLWPFRMPGARIKSLGGQFGRNFKAIKEAEPVTNWNVIAGCGENEYSMEDPALGHGVMTWAITEILTKYGPKLTRNQIVEKANQLAVRYNQTLMLIGDQTCFDKPIF